MPFIKCPERFISLLWPFSRVCICSVSQNTSLCYVISFLSCMKDLIGKYIWGRYMVLKHWRFHRAFHRQIKFEFFKIKWQFFKRLEINSNKFLVEIFVWEADTRLVFCSAQLKNYSLGYTEYRVSATHCLTPSNLNDGSGWRASSKCSKEKSVSGKHSKEVY